MTERQQVLEAGDGKGEVSEYSRRDFLHTSVLSGLSLAIASFTGCSSKKSSPEVVAAESILEGKLATFQELYLKDGTIADKQQLNELFLQSEHLRFLQAGGKTAVTFAEFQTEVYLPLKQRIGESFQELISTADAEADPMIALKLAVFEALGQSIKYNKEFNSVLDPIVNQRLQCRSATQLFLQFAREFDQDLLKAGEQLVVIYTDTHALPGKLDTTGELRAYEMTSSGAGFVDFGPLEQCTVPMRVCKSDHVAAQAILGTRIHSELVIVHDTLGSTTFTGSYEKPIALAAGKGEGSSVANLISGAMNSATECFGFSSGKVTVPEGDQEIFARSYISSSNYQSSSAPVPDSSSSGADTVALDRLPASERRTVMNYLQHNQYFVDCWDRQAGILNNDQSTIGEKKILFRQLINEMETYWDRNAISSARDMAGDVLAPRGLEPSIEPAAIFNKIQHNWSVLQRR